MKYIIKYAATGPRGMGVTKAQPLLTVETKDDKAVDLLHLRTFMRWVQDRGVIYETLGVSDTITALINRTRVTELSGSELDAYVYDNMVPLAQLVGGKLAVYT